MVPVLAVQEEQSLGVERSPEHEKGYHNGGWTTVAVAACVEWCVRAEERRQQLKRNRAGIEHPHASTSGVLQWCVGWVGA